MNKPPPGYPERWRRDPQPTQAPQPPVVESAPIVVQGQGWRLSVPLVVLTGIVSSVGARMLPTNTSTDTGIAELRASLQIRDLREAEFREMVRVDLRAIRERVERSDDETRNRFAQLEAKLGRVEQK